MYGNCPLEIRMEMSVSMIAKLYPEFIVPDYFIEQFSDCRRLRDLLARRVTDSGYLAGDQKIATVDMDQSVEFNVGETVQELPDSTTETSESFEVIEIVTNEAPNLNDKALCMHSKEDFLSLLIDALCAEEFDNYNFEDNLISDFLRVI